MKLITTTFLTLFVTTAFACPDLTGTYQCEKDANDPKDTGVQSWALDNSDQSLVYLLKDADESEAVALPTDGQTYQDGDSSYTGSCSADAFKVALTGVDQQVGPYTVNMTFKLDASKNLVNSGLVKFKYNGQPQQQTFTSTCKKL